MHRRPFVATGQWRTRPTVSQHSSPCAGVRGHAREHERESPAALGWGIPTWGPAAPSGLVAGCGAPPRSSTCITLSSASPGQRTQLDASPGDTTANPGCRHSAAASDGTRRGTGMGPARGSPHMPYLHQCRTRRRWSSRCGGRRRRETASYYYSVRPRSPPAPACPQ